MSMSKKKNMKRRNVLRGAAAAIVGAGSAAIGGPRGKGSSQPSSPAAAPQPPGGSALHPPLDLSVARVQTVTVNVPFRAVPARNMIRGNPHWTIFQICKVHLACGVVGFGETMEYYTWGRVSEAELTRVRGKNAAELMWDDSLGAGLQMALFDAVGKAASVPCYRLFGQRVRKQTPVSWWAIDMPGEDWVLGCRDALRSGYMAFKTKGRPWFDLEQQMKTLTATLPQDFEVDIDFNGLLLDAQRAIPVLQSLQRYAELAIYETPIPQQDIDGNKRLRAQTRVPIAMHYGTPAPPVAVREGVCDGFVVGGGASSVMRAGHLAGEAQMPFWLQLVGTSITATFSLHFGAVLEKATWPAVNCHQLYTHAMVQPPMEIRDGTAPVPEGPGLGVELDEEAVERLRIEPPESRPYPAPGLLIGIRWPSGKTSYYAHTRQYRDDFSAGKLPVFAAGVELKVIPNDGTPEWKELQRQAQKSGVHREKTLLW